GSDIESEPRALLPVVGPSGCGKSTLLRLISGLDTNFDGRIGVGSRDVCGPDPTVGVVFQEPRLFPWLNLTDNVACVLSDGRSSRTRQLVQETLDVVGLGAFANALPKQLSGGMAQRAAL